jgi:hypothetical protein
MTFPRARLAVAATLFILWLLYLLSLVIVSRHTIVLSRPQFLVADLSVLAEVKDDGGKPSPDVTIRAVYWSIDPRDSALVDTPTTIANLPFAVEQGYDGPGLYILPLRNDGTREKPQYEIKTVPFSPGYVPNFVKVVVFAGPGAAVDAARVARLASEYLDVNAEEVRAAIQAIAPKGGSRILARAVRRDRAEQFRKALDDEKKGVGVELPGDDLRIYPLTPETKEQIDEMTRVR